ncbi:MAG: YciC family protein [Candidatus Lightella neohaematopini]|nr:YciC family protein [Candidatus Lightella neohaematopini]
MSINILRNIYFDVTNFIRNQFYNIMMLVLIVSIINTLINHTLISFNEKLLLNNIIIEHGNLNLNQFIQQLSSEQQHLLLKVSIINTITNLINNILIISGMLIMIDILKYTKKEQIVKILIFFLTKKLPRLSILIFLLTIIIQFGLLLLVIPGVILTILLSFSPIILFTNQVSISKSIYNSIIFGINNFKLVYPIILLWLIIKMVLLIIITKLFFITPLATNIILNSVNNLLLSILTIYIVRLYLFINK